jgi:hypothetical protein
LASHLLWEQGIMQVQVLSSRLMLLLQAIAVFLFVLAGEIFWTQWHIQVQKHNKLKASFATFMIVVFGGVTFISYTKQNWLLCPAALGGAVGTYLTMFYNERKEKRLHGHDNASK